MVQDLRRSQAAGAMGIWADKDAAQALALADFADALRAQVLATVKSSQLFDGSTTITVRDSDLERLAAAAPTISHQ